MKTREEYENLINSSEIFGVDKADEARFKTEFRKLTGWIVSYYLTLSKTLRDELNFETDKQSEMSDSLSYQLIVTAKTCVNSYKKDYGPFLHYFNASLKRNRVRSTAAEKAKTERGGLTMGRKSDRLISGLIRYAKSRGRSIYDEEVQRKFAIASGCKPEVISKLVQANDAAVCVGEYVKGDDGEQLSLIEGKAADLRSVDETLEQQSTIYILLNGMGVLFDEQQERTKPRLKKLLTAWLISRIGNKEAVGRYLVGQAFIDGEILQTYIKSGFVPKAKDLADEFGVSEQRASMIVNNFIKKINKNVKL